MKGSSWNWRRKEEVRKRRIAAQTLLVFWQGDLLKEPNGENELWIAVWLSGKSQLQLKDRTALTRLEKFDEKPWSMFLFCCLESWSFIKAPTPARLANPLHCHHLWAGGAAPHPSHCYGAGEAQAPRVREESQLSSLARSWINRTRLHTGVSLLPAGPEPTREGSALNREANPPKAKMASGMGVPSCPPGEHLLHCCPVMNHGPQSHPRLAWQLVFLQREKEGFLSFPHPAGSLLTPLPLSCQSFQVVLGYFWLGEHVGFSCRFLMPYCKASNSIKIITRQVRSLWSNFEPLRNSMDEFGVPCWAESFLLG